jgi:hypothetical protein
MKSYFKALIAWIFRAHLVDNYTEIVNACVVICQWINLQQLSLISQYSFWDIYGQNDQN